LNHADTAPLQNLFVIQLNDGGIGALLTLHIETDRVIVRFMWQTELKEAILVQGGEGSLVFESSV
jgi:hypothetical protein